MASRAEQKAAARAAREARHREIVASKQRRQRLTVLGAILAVAVAAVVVAIVVSSGSSPASTKAATKVSKSSAKTVAGYVNSDLDGIRQSGNLLGNPSAPVTVTEYGDLVCPVCADFAVTSEQQLITDEVRTGKVKLIYKAFDTASSYANQSAFVTSQVAALSAGLQDKEWNFILTTYFEQPTTINGQDAEDVPYVTTSYLQSRASQIKGLNLINWQANLTSKKLANEVAADLTAGDAAGVDKVGTPSILVSGPGGTEYYDQNGSESSPVPTIAQLQAMITQSS